MQSDAEYFLFAVETLHAHWSSLFKRVTLTGLREFQVFMHLALRGTAFVLMVVLLELIFVSQ